MQLTTHPIGHASLPPRPALAPDLQQFQDQSLALERALRSINADLVRRAPGGPNPIPTRAAADQALASLAAIRSASHVVTGHALDLFTGTGRYSAWSSFPEQITIHAGFLNRSEQLVSTALNTAVDQRDQAAWTTAQGLLSQQLISAMSLMGVPHNVQVNRFTTTQDAYAESIIAERDGRWSAGGAADGRLEIATEARTDGSRSFGLMHDATRLLVAADSGGDGDGFVSRDELFTLSGVYNPDHDVWLNKFDLGRIAEKYPMQTRMREPGDG